MALTDNMRLSLSTLRLTIVTLMVLLTCTVGAAQEKKIAYGILLDNTGSMRSQFNVVNQVGRAMVHRVHTQGPVSLFGFHSSGAGSGQRAAPAVRIEASQDEQLLNRGIDNSYVVPGQTTLLDAVAFIAQTLDRSAPDKNKIIILVTDGEDRNSGTDLKKLINEMKAHNIAVFAVGLVQQLDDEHGLIRLSPRTKAINVLKSLTKETGGRVAFPRSTPVEMEKVLAELALP